MMQPPNSQPHHHHHHHLLLHLHHHHHPFGPFPHTHLPFLHLSPCIHKPSLLLPHHHHHHHHPTTPCPLLLPPPPPPPTNSASPAPDGPKEVRSFASTAAAEKAGFSAPGLQQEGLKEHEEVEEAEEEEEEEVVFVLTDEWREFFAKSEAKRRLAKQQKRKGTK